MDAELRRLKEGLSECEVPGGIGFAHFVVGCDMNAHRVLEIAKATLLTALQLTKAGTSDMEAWRNKLPRDFVRNSVSHPTVGEVEIAMKKPIAERIEANNKSPWSLEMFRNSLTPELEMKKWTWWSCTAINENQIELAVCIDCLPFPWQSLRWLFLGSGALEVVEKQAS